MILLYGQYLKKKRYGTLTNSLISNAGNLGYALVCRYRHLIGSFRRDHTSQDVMPYYVLHDKNPSLFKDRECQTKFKISSLSSAIVQGCLHMMNNKQSMNQSISQSIIQSIYVGSCCHKIIDTLFLINNIYCDTLILSHEFMSCSYTKRFAREYDKPLTLDSHSTTGPL